MLNKRIEKIINEQINAETYSSYLYLAMSAYCSELGLAGFANWLKIQAKEELFHADFMFNYLIERNGRVVLESIEKPPVQWNNVIEIFEETLKHEQYISSRINDILNAALEEKDHATASFYKWFIDEQVEEEATATDVLSKLKLTKAEGSALFFMDQEMQKRVFVQPMLK
ncbi:MAG: ferritin [bacterium]